MAAIYRGYSTLDFGSGVSQQGIYPSVNVRQIAANQNPINKAPLAPGSNTFILTDIDLVERNILNNLFTPVGSRLMMPTFGTRISQMLFEPLDQFLLNDLYAEIEKVINYDPRVNLINLAVTPDYITGSVTVNIYLQYIQLNVASNITFDLSFTQ